MSVTAGTGLCPQARDTAREFLAPVVARAVESLGLAAGSWVLDAGTGSGGALPHLAVAVGAAGTVRGVDIDPDAVARARSYVDRHGRVRRRVTVERADAIETAELAATAPGGGFDAIWAGDLVGPRTFADPAAAVGALARALRPGGVLALYSGNDAHTVLLPGRSRLERVARAALERAEPADVDGARLLHWLQDAGLGRPSLAAFPRVVTSTGADPVAREHLQRTVWPRVRRAVSADPDVAGVDREELLGLTDPDDPRHVLDGPGWYALQPTILVTARRDRGGRR